MSADPGTRDHLGPHPESFFADGSRERSAIAGTTRSAASRFVMPDALSAVHDWMQRLDQAAFNTEQPVDRHAIDHA